MNSKLSKILSLVSGLIGVIAIIFLIRIVMVGDDALKENVDLQNSILSPFVSFAKIILIITAIIALVFSIWNLIQHPKQLKKALISIVALGILLAIAYVIADDGETLNTSGVVLKNGEAGSTSKWVSTGIWYSFILGAVALLGVSMDFLKSLVSK
jgi:hypothetical protein